MARLQLSITVRNAKLNQFEVAIGASPKLRLMSGTIPTNCGSADIGDVLCEIILPADYMTAASAGTKGKLGTWSGTGTEIAGAGTLATHFRIKNSLGTTTHCQGDISAAGGGAAMIVDDPMISAGETVTVSTFTLVEGNA